MSVHLLPLQGGEPVEVPEGLTLLGRDGQCDVRLLGDFVSKMHCVLAHADGCLLVRDLGSKNGTRVNGVRVRRAHLRGQDVLCVGGTVFLVATDCERPPDPPGPGKGRRPDPASLSGA
jgi:pSer/pThr/pTyr-binding forkhead associated (FHA) protein